MGLGVILLPYVTAMELFFEQGLERAYYAMHGSNLHANAFRDRILKMFPTGERVMENYCRVPPAQGVCEPQ